MFEVEEGIKVPARGPGQKMKYPWNKMEIGDSFLVKASTDSRLKVQQCITACAGSYGKRHGMKFASRQVEDGVRVWRIE